uniref:DUF659 domain-containing protein n=1 Tax=Moniliophthora roreri TaxID=221103 RepID=A0A0W0GAT8_MONRR
MPCPTNPFILEHFTKLREVENNSCRHFFSCNYCGDKPNSAGASIEHRDNNLFNHIVSTEACPDAPTAAHAAAHHCMVSKKQNLGAENVGETEVSRTAKKRKVERQRTLDGIVDFGLYEGQQQCADLKLFHFIVHSCSAFRSAENPYLEDFCNEIRPSYMLPSRYVLSHTILDSENGRVYLLEVARIASFKWILTLLIDRWKDLLKQALYSTAAAQVGEYPIVMGLRNLTGLRGEAQKILETALLAMKDMAVEDAACFIALVTDNPTIMQSFRRKFEERFPWVITLACFLHQMNTLANTVVTFFNNSHYWGGQLKEEACKVKITQGLKKNCESCWYAIILLALSVLLHRRPLGAICLQDNAKKSSGGLSVVFAKVIQIVLTDEDCWQYLSQVTKVVKPFVDAIGNCESRESTLADCMLQLLSCACTLTAISCDDDEDEEFLAHAQCVLNRQFHKITTSAGFTLTDITNTTLGLAKKWNWSFEEATVLKKDIKLYYHCKEPFTGGTGRAKEWWERLPINTKSHPLKVLAIIIHSIVPHATEIERLFSHLNGFQMPKHNNLSTPTFKKLAKLRNHYDREIWEKNRAAGKSTHHKHAHMHAKDSLAITSTVTQELESCLTWEPPLDTDDSNPNSSQSEIEKDPVEDAFEQLEKEMMEEVTDKAGDSGPSLVRGEIFNFDEIKKTLDGIVPTPYVETIEVVWEGGQTGTGWSISDIV